MCSFTKPVTVPPPPPPDQACAVGTAFEIELDWLDLEAVRSNNISACNHVQHPHSRQQASNAMKVYKSDTIYDVQ